MNVQQKEEKGQSSKVKHLGRKEKDEKTVKQALKLYAEREANGLSVNDIVKATGVPRSTIYAKIKEKAVIE